MLWFPLYLYLFQDLDSSSLNWFENSLFIQDFNSSSLNLFQDSLFIWALLFIYVFQDSLVSIYLDSPEINRK